MPYLEGGNSYLNSLHRPKRHIESGSQLCKARINPHVDLLGVISEFTKRWKLGKVDRDEPYLHKKQLKEDISKYIDERNQEDPENASEMNDTIIEEDPKAESSGPDYSNREEDQYICHAGDEAER